MLYLPLQYVTALIVSELRQEKLFSIDLSVFKVT